MAGRGLHRKANGRSLLIWTGAGRGQGSIIGPATSFRLVGPSLRNERTGREVAAYHEGTWFCRPTNRSFSVMWAEHETLVRCQNPATGQTAMFGPFDMIGLVDNMIYVNREHSHGLARLDEATRQWKTLDDKTAWPEIVLLPAPAPAFQLEQIWPSVGVEYSRG